MEKIANITGVIDIESNCLLSDAIDFSSLPYRLKENVKIWCVSVRNLNTGEVKTLVKDEITKKSLDNLLKPFTTIIAHNGHKFDFVKLMLLGLIDYKIGYLGEKDLINGREVRLLDTLIMSRLSNPDRAGGHSLGAWGIRVGDNKMDYREALINKGVLERNSPKGFEFSFYDNLMPEYCEQDTLVTGKAYREIMKEFVNISDWSSALQQEHKLADLAIRRECIGFKFDKELALRNIEELTSKMVALQNKVNPILPKKPLTQVELNSFTPPIIQLKKDGEWSSHMLNFFNRNKIEEYSSNDEYFVYKGNIYEAPYLEPLEKDREATIDDLDIVKSHLISIGWNPSEWKERDLTKDSKKQSIPLDKQRKALDRYLKETLEGKFKENRLKILGLTEANVERELRSRLGGRRAVKVPTSPCIKVGVTKDLCPNLISLGDKVSFANDVAEYYTYRHRRSAIAGGDIDEMDFDEDVPNTGYLANYREEDGRIPTPSIEVGAATNRYKHISVANVPRASSLFGKEMRSMFGCGEGYVQFGFDYASLEARIEGHYVYDYEGGAELAVSLLAEKPNDIHSLTSVSMGIPRDQAKSVNYAILYGASANKFVSMLGMTKSEAEQFYTDYWENNPALKALKTDKDQEWISTGKVSIKSIDGRSIRIRSQHSILNALFQSAGVICAKYITVKLCQKMEALGYNIDPFKGELDFSLMIEYHDENQTLTKPELLSFKKFNSKEEAQEFCKNWEGEQLGAIQEGKNEIYYVTLPSVISRSVTESIKEVEEMFNMKVGLGYEYVTGRNWYECH